MKLIDIIFESKEKEVDEQLQAILKLGKNATTAVKGAIDDVLKYTLKDGKVLQTASKTPLTTVDDVVKAMKAGTLGSESASQLASGLLKTNKCPRNVQIELVTEIAAGSKFKNIIGSVKSETALIKRLKTKGYTDETIELFIGRAKEQKIGPYANVAKVGSTGKTGATGGKTGATGGKTGAGTGKGGTSTTQVLTDPKGWLSRAAEGLGKTKVGKFTGSIFKNLRPVARTWGMIKFLTYCAIFGIGGIILYDLWKKLIGGYDTVPTDDEINEMEDFVNCIVKPLKDDEGAEIMEDGDNVALKYKVDELGGKQTGGYVIFYSNYVVKTAKGETGKWSCNKTGLLNEQSSGGEMTSAQMSRLIDELDDQLSGDYFEGDSTDMMDALNALKGAVGMTYKGKDAIKVLVSNYPKIVGVSLENHVEELINLDFEAMEAKDEFLSIIGSSKAGKSQGDSDSSDAGKVDGDGNPNTGLSHLTIIWDDSKDDGGGGGGGTVKFRPCSDFPFEIGCINDKIKDLQGCLNKRGSLLKTDGYYGPKTHKDLLDQSFFADDDPDDKIITQKMYDRFMALCNKEVKRDVVTPIDDLKSKGLTPLPIVKLDPPGMIDLHGQQKLLDQAKKTIDGQVIQSIIDNDIEYRRGRYVLKQSKELTVDQLTAINRYMAGKGFTLDKKRETLKDSKYVWVADDRMARRQARLEKRGNKIQDKIDNIER